MKNSININFSSLILNTNNRIGHAGYYRSQTAHDPEGTPGIKTPLEIRV